MEKVGLIHWMVKKGSCLNLWIYLSLFIWAIGKICQTFFFVLPCSQKGYRFWRVLWFCTCGKKWQNKEKKRKGKGQNINRRGKEKDRKFREEERNRKGREARKSKQRKAKGRRAEKARKGKEDRKRQEKGQTVPHTHTFQNPNHSYVKIYKNIRTGYDTSWSNKKLDISLSWVICFSPLGSHQQPISTLSLELKP